MSDSCELSIILPAYREADSLRQLLPRILASARRLTPDFEVLVIDTQTPEDATGQVCSEHGVHHLYRKGSNSYGDAVRTGIRKSRGRYVIIMDADGSHNPGYFGRLWRLRHDYDVAIGSRYTSGGHTKVHAGLTLQSRLLNSVYRRAFGLHTCDMSNSFRLYRGNQLRALTLHSTNFEIVEEILIALVCGPAQARIIEIPIIFECRQTGKSKRQLPSFLVSYVRSIRRLRQFRATALAEFQAEQELRKIG